MSPAPVDAAARPDTIPPGAVASVLVSPLSATTDDALGTLPACPAPGGRKMTGPLPGGREFSHRPVMLEEVLALLEPVPSGLVVDATVGGAGHAAAILRASPHRRLLGIDRDRQAVDAAAAALAPFGERAHVRQARFDELAAVVADERRRLAARQPAAAAAVVVAAVLFDLGVSSHQLDDPGRGFSYRQRGPLDMRMDRGGGRPAADLVNGAGEDELAELFMAHGEARFARRIARAVVAARPLATTAELAEAVSSAVPAAARRRGHPARRVFQALRAAVNEELEILPGALDQAIDLLSPGGRCVVLAYHSGEDRIVKARLRQATTGGCRCPPGLPCGCGARPTALALTRGSRRPTAAEIAANPRAEAARLRAVERLHQTGEEGR